MDFLQLPFFEKIKDSKTILLAGAGGGYDIFTGLPLYFGLKGLGKTVYLANLSFATIYASNGKRLAPGLVEINHDTKGHLEYFPELHLVRWLKEQGEETPIYCFDRTGVIPLFKAYSYLNETLALDSIILIDGGTDSLMRGDEPGLGTPHEDIASIAAVNSIDVATKLLVCLGFGVDAFHGVCHAYFLEAVAELIQKKAFLGAWTLTQEMPEVKRYREACDYVFNRMRNNPSIVNASILSAIEGQFGNHHATYRTEGNELFINTLMSLYWCFELRPVAERILYLDNLYGTSTVSDIDLVIKLFRGGLKKSEMREWVNLPM